MPVFIICHTCGSQVGEGPEQPGHEYTCPVCREHWKLVRGYLGITPPFRAVLQPGDPEQAALVQVSKLSFQRR